MKTFSNRRTRMGLFLNSIRTLSLFKLQRLCASVRAAHGRWGCLFLFIALLCIPLRRIGRLMTVSLSYLHLLLPMSVTLPSLLIRYYSLISGTLLPIPSLLAFHFHHRGCCSTSHCLSSFPPLCRHVPVEGALEGRGRRVRGWRVARRRARGEEEAPKHV